MKKPLFILLLIVFSAGNVGAENITAAWDTVTDPDLAGYRLFYRPAGEMEYDDTSPIWEGQTTTCQVEINQDGYFVVKAFDDAGAMSGPSNEVFEGRISAPLKPATPVINVIGREITATWADNAEPDVKGYRLYYRTIGNPNFDMAAPICETKMPGCKAQVALDGFFAVVAVDETDLVSPLSDEVYEGRLSAPGTPNELIINLLGSMDANIKNIDKKIGAIMEEVKDINIKIKKK